MKEKIKLICVYVLAIGGVILKGMACEKVSILLIMSAFGIILSFLVDEIVELIKITASSAKKRRTFKDKKREEIFEEKVLRIIRKHEANQLVASEIAPKKRRYFSAAEVRAMSLDEVAENYEAICESMKEWGENG